MSGPKSTRVFPAIRLGGGGSRTDSLELLGEEPLLIRIDDKPYTVVMRTPGQEIAHATGFCLGEGIIDSRSHIKTLGYDENLDPNLIDVWLTPERRAQIPEVLERRAFFSQTSCGICGKEMIEDLHQSVAPLSDRFTLTREQVFGCLEQLDKNQEHYQTTRSSHAALLFDEQLHVISFGEDVGRHNALDKAIGRAMMEDRLEGARVVVLSSRNSFEMVQKSARAQIPIAISNSRPTALAIQMGQSLNMTLTFPAREELLIVSGEHRISGC